jgi:hypothetical protein
MNEENPIAEKRAEQTSRAWLAKRGEHAERARAAFVEAIAECVADIVRSEDSPFALPDDARPSQEAASELLEAHELGYELFRHIVPDVSQAMYLRGDIVEAILAKLRKIAE